MPDFGFLNVDKPAGMTSHDVVAKLRRELKIKKVGHAGTLDPMATGVLVMCIGHATRLSEYAMASQKRYLATVHLGITTTTYDAEGQPTQTHDPGHVTRTDVENLLPQFIGEIDQLPPIYSAIKQGGRKLYQMARAGEEVERQPRRVTIYSIDIVEWSPPTFKLEVSCGAGTYIRSLAHDIGALLGVGGHLSGLVRTASGAFTLENAVALEAIVQSPDWRQYLLPPRTALHDMPSVNLEAAAVDDVVHGRPLIPQEIPDSEFARAYTPEGEFLAILRADGRLWRPHKVFINA